MPILGTKKFWMPIPSASKVEKENQILKNAGYFNLQLHAVNYMSKGNFFQDIFGGKDKVALSTSLKYQSGVTSIDATSVQDVREVKVNGKYNFGLQRNVAVKIPTNCDAISIDVRMTAVKNDHLGAKFDMLNKPEYQGALQLAPMVVGQVITITSLVKKLFTDSDPQAQLEASVAGIISEESEENPVANGKLTKGMLILISTNDGDSFSSVDISKFEVKGDSLFYKTKPVENTYVIFIISFEALRGNDEKAAWFKKYGDALNNLDKIHLTVDPSEIQKIYADSKTLWIEGNALIDADETYVNKERINIKSAAIKTINEKYKSLMPIPTAPAISAREILSILTMSGDVRSLEEALPATSQLLNLPSQKIRNVKPKAKGLKKAKKANQEESLSASLNKDVQTYLKELKENGLAFNLK